MARATYTWGYFDWDGKRFISIRDTGNRRCTVTNDIENVVHEISCQTDIKNSLIIYRDSLGTWDGWNHEKGHFLLLRAKDQISAATQYLEMIQQGVD